MQSKKASDAIILSDITVKGWLKSRNIVEANMVVNLILNFERRILMAGIISEIIRRAAGVSRLQFKQKVTMKH